MMKEKKIKDGICNFISKILPLRIIYWVIINVWAKATTKKYLTKHPDEVTWSMAIKSLEECWK